VAESEDEAGTQMCNIQTADGLDYTMDRRQILMRYFLHSKGLIESSFILYLE
jgi:hypothetical protein